MPSPVMPEWNDLTSEEKIAIDQAWEIYSCPHSCGGDALYVYDEIRKVLAQGEKRYLRATMEGPPAEHFADGD